MNTSSTTFGEVLASHAAARPDAPAVTCGTDTLTWAELERDSNRLAHTWSRLGVTPGSYTSIMLDNSPAFMTAAFASWKLGAVPQPLSSRLTPAELRAILEVVVPAGVVGLPDNVGSVANDWVTLPSVTETTECAESLPLRIAPSWKAPTSGGSTGRPKVVVSGNAAVLEEVNGFADVLRIPTAGTVAVPGPLHHNAPFMFAALAMLRGSHVVLQGRFDAETLLADISSHGVQWLYAVPTMMQRIWRLGPEMLGAQDVSTLNLVVHMAAPCPPWLKRAWIGWLGGERILEVYAGTEAQAASAITGTDWLRHPGSVGPAVVGEFTVLGPDGAPLPPGEVGEVWVRRGADSPPAYTYIGGTARTRDGGWESLGDLGSLDEEGYLYLTDRDTDVVLVGGSNVYPAEVEAALVEHPDIDDACVVGLPHEDLGAVPHAIVQSSAEVDLDYVLPFLRERLSSYKLPRSLEVVASQLRDDAGKMRRSTLRAQRLEGVNDALGHQ
ncbi:AMP-binding protein [Rhodococcus ruber]|uniref:AMP-binding protein n=1 Tax=Rhodococcus ruber TaxID=1830 RepID=A0ABT4MEC7_9NOCA|nr:AMP-binding protein [Rhodococcus ruber]MCZ4519356.1 AMP-binding protein [Rhodococcus ruber]